MRIAIAILGAVVCACAQDIKFPAAFDKLAARAAEHAEVTLDENMLQFAGGFMNEGRREANAKRLIAGLKGIYVRSFEFAKENEYSLSDLDEIRNQLQAPAWSRIVNVASKRESAEVYLKRDASGQAGGMVVIAAEARELTVVNIVGSIRPEDIGALSRQFGIPDVNIGAGRAAPAPAAPPAPPAPRERRGRDSE